MGSVQRGKQSLKIVAHAFFIYQIANGSVKPERNIMENEKTFTQEEVNAILGKRLAEQKTAMSKDLTLKEQELNERELKIKAVETLKEKGLPADLVECLRYENEEIFNKGINHILEMKRTDNGEFKPIEGEKLPKGNKEDVITDKLRDIFVKKR